MRSALQSDARPGVSRNVQSRIIRLQQLTLAWMSVECGIAIFSAWKAHSPALLAFGSDSFVELLSAIVVLLQFAPGWTLGRAQAARLGGILLFVLAGLVTFTSVTALVRHIRPDTSWSGIGVTIAALVIMPSLSRAKRKAAQGTRNAALAADAVQSATCAYLAALTLSGLVINAIVHLRWIDPIAALAAVPIISIEAWRALRGSACDCC